MEQTRRRFRFLLEQKKSVTWIGLTGRYLTGGLDGVSNVVAMKDSL
ncbi:MAG: hypothetical protein KDI50_06905 [Candidatus Competibacteraceae bacterium]|nr:hypothetical protein [Candidatus Competibacteraceae bacterium]